MLSPSRSGRKARNRPEEDFAQNLATPGTRRSGDVAEPADATNWRLRGDLLLEIAAAQGVRAFDFDAARIDRVDERNWP
jgi:hypothetical protein